MKAFFTIKFHEDCKNKLLIETISSILDEKGIKNTAIAKDFEKWGKIKFEPKELMRITFEEIDKADIVIVELSEKGVGIGIEAGYSYAKSKPIIVIAKEGADISNTLRGIAKKVILYKNMKDLSEKINFL